MRSVATGTRRRRLLAGTILAVGFTATPAFGTPEATAAEENATSSSNDVPRVDEAKVVVLALRGDALDAAAVQQALASELNRHVVMEHTSMAQNVEGIVTVSYDAQRRELVVAWDRGGQTVTRVIATTPEQAVADAALLTGNLVHQQVDDLLQPREVASPPPVAAPVVTEKPLRSPPTPERRIATAGLFYPLASHYDAPGVTTHFDFNLLHGRVGAVDGVQLGGANVITRSADEGSAQLSGLQLGYLTNVVLGEASGVQIAGFFNQTSGPARAWQAAGAVNLASEALTGVQTAFLFNSAARLRGVQAGLVNRAGNVDGLQLGLVNVAATMRGVSVGLINIADDIDGVPIAPFSVTRTGGVHPTVWSGTSGLANVGVKLSTRATYTMFFGGYHRAFNLQFLGGGFVMGGRVPLGGDLYSDIDVSGTYLISPRLSSDEELDRSYHEQLVQPRLRAMLAYRAAHHFGAFVGVAATGQLRSELGWNRVTASAGPELFGGLEL